MRYAVTDDEEHKVTSGPEDSGDSEFEIAANSAKSRSGNGISKKRKLSSSEEIPAPKKRRTRHTEKTTLSLGPSTTKNIIYDCHGRPVDVQVQGDLTLAGKVDWDARYQRDKIYKRNMFHVTDAYYTINAPSTHSDGYLYVEGEKVSSLWLGIAGRLSDEDGQEALVEQFTNAQRKAKRSPPRWQTVPNNQNPTDADSDVIHASRLGQYSLSTGEAAGLTTSTCQWTRVQFRFGTEHNGDRRSAQTYYCMVVSLIARLANGTEVTIATCKSPQYIVVARSPSGIKKGQTSGSLAADRKYKTSRTNKQTTRYQTLKGPTKAEESGSHEAGPSTATAALVAPMVTDSLEFSVMPQALPEAGREECQQTLKDAEECPSQSQLARANSQELTLPAPETAEEELPGIDFLELFSDELGLLADHSEETREEPTLIQAATRTQSTLETPADSTSNVQGHVREFDASVSSASMDQTLWDQCEEFDRPRYPLAGIEPPAVEGSAFTDDEVVAGPSYPPARGPTISSRPLQPDFGPVPLPERGASVWESIGATFAAPPAFPPPFVTDADWKNILSEEFL